MIKVEITEGARINKQFLKDKFSCGNILDRHKRING
jgi:hypothetical protein